MAQGVELAEKEMRWRLGVCSLASLLLDLSLYLKLPVEEEMHLVGQLIENMSQGSMECDPMQMVSLGPKISTRPLSDWNSRERAAHQSGMRILVWYHRYADQARGNVDRSGIGDLYVKALLVHGIAHRRWTTEGTSCCDAVSFCSARLEWCRRSLSLGQPGPPWSFDFGDTRLDVKFSLDVHQFVVRRPAQERYFNVSTPPQNLEEIFSPEFIDEGRHWLRALAIIPWLFERSSALVSWAVATDFLYMHVNSADWRDPTYEPPPKGYLSVFKLFSSPPIYEELSFVLSLRTVRVSNMNADHRRLLGIVLLEFCDQTKQPVPLTLHSALWLQMGFQDKDPVIDLRGSGLASLVVMARCALEWRRCFENCKLDFCRVVTLVTRSVLDATHRGNLQKLYSSIDATGLSRQAAAQRVLARFTLFALNVMRKVMPGSPVDDEDGCDDYTEARVLQFCTDPDLVKLTESADAPPTSALQSVFESLAPLGIAY